MTTTNKNVPLATPDFDEIKVKLLEFLSSQDELKDYDFSGSTLSVLLDLLAYNTHMNAFMLNMVGNEAFLSTAVRRSSVVMNARDLGYIPTSAKCAYVNLYLEYEPIGAPSTSITIPAGTAFGAATNGVSYVFNVIDDHLAVYSPTLGKYVVENLTAYEGRKFTHIFTVVGSPQLGSPDVVYDVNGQGVSVPNLNVDSSIMRVYVNDPAVSTDYALYDKYNGNLNLDGRSNVCFVSEDEVGRINIKFGDGILGRKPGVGSKIKVEYIVSSGPDANGVALFNQTTAIPNGMLTKATAINPAGGGAFRESEESIKFNAPLSFEAQERGVLAEDYAYLTKQVYPNAKSVISWGGQDNDPPQFGKVFVSVQPQTGVVITQGDKDVIKSHLSKKGVMTIIPVILDPDYIFIDVSATVRYSATQSSVIGGQLETKVANRITEYSETVLSTFKANLEFSRFLAYIDASDSGILSNHTKISLAKRFYITHNQETQGDIKFSNTLLPGSVTSTRFTYGTFTNCRFGSYGDNGLAILSEQAGNTLVIVSDIGTINYEDGTVTIKPVTVSGSDPLYFDSLTQQHFIRVTAAVLDTNVQIKKNQILKIDEISVASEKV